HYESKREIILNSLKKAADSSEFDLAGDEIDKIQGNALYEIFEKLSARGAGQLTLIDNALRIIAEEGSAINECEECGESIGEKRLMALLGVRVCVHCAEEAENNSKMFA